MRLSIGMIVKNEEKYLEKCILALGSLRRNVECELIIVDTGSTDSTVQIAQCYTDKVYHFDWCDDFAAARNETLKYASGEWYMFLDADEIFSDTDEIERFMNSDERNNWVSASFVINNYNDEAMSSYLPFDAMRIIRRTDDLHFVGSLHERFAGSMMTDSGNVPNCFRLKSCAEHFGYVSDNDKLTEKHKRNKSIIYKDFEKRKNDPIYFMQLYEIALGERDIEKITEYALKCIELSKNIEAMSAVAYMLYANVLYISGEYEQTLSTAKKYFKQKRTFDHACDIAMYMFRGVAHFNMGSYKKAAADFERYFELRKNYGSYKSVESYIHQIFGLDDDTYGLRILECAVSYEQLGDAEGLSRLLRSVQPQIFDTVPMRNKGYDRDYVTHAVLLAAEAGDRSAIDYIAENGSDYLCGLMRDVISETTSNPQSEIELYAAQVKATIRSLISGGMRQQARVIIEQYKQLSPNDPEIAEIENSL